MPGRKATPTVLKKIMGNPGKKKLNKHEPIPERGMPAMPEWLEAFPVAVEEWEREGEILYGMGILTVAEAGIFAQRCYLSAQIQEAAIKIKDTDPEDRSYAQITNLIKEYRQVGSLLGLDPSSRAKLSVEQPVKSKFQGLLINGGKK